jgi:uncharacterized protein
MRIKATKGKQGIGTEVKDMTYVEAARLGRHGRWRYVLGLVVIFFLWLVVGRLVPCGANTPTILKTGKAYFL